MCVNCTVNYTNIERNNRIRLWKQLLKDFEKAGLTQELVDIAAVQTEIKRLETLNVEH